MNKKEELIKDLKELFFGLSKQVLARAVQCKIFKDEGFLKLAAKFSAHQKEETEYSIKIMEHIIDLGGEIDLNEEVVKKDYSIEKDPIKYLQKELEISENGLSWLKKIIEKSRDEYLTYEFLVEYFKDEDEDLNWTKAQLNLIKIIGEQNWLKSQI